jgi:hypothetical protein
MAGVFKAVQVEFDITVKNVKVGAKVENRMAWIS